jgi:hypothetical protein
MRRWAKAGKQSCIYIELQKAQILASTHILSSVSSSCVYDWRFLLASAPLGASATYGDLDLHQLRVACWRRHAKLARLS